MGTKEYLRQHRIRHAAYLLEQTGQSINAIGAECGFEDMSYFARVFREERKINIRSSSSPIPLK